MTQDETDKAAGVLLLTVARALRNHIAHNARDTVIRDLDAALAPFEPEKPIGLIEHEPHCALITNFDGVCDCGHVPPKSPAANDGKQDGAHRALAERLAALQRAAPYDAILHADDVWSISTIGRFPQMAVAKTPHRGNAEALASALNQWAAGPASDAALECLRGDFEALREEHAKVVADRNRLQDAIRWALGESEDGFDPGTATARYWWRAELRRMAFGDLIPSPAFEERILRAIPNKFRSTMVGELTVFGHVGGPVADYANRSMNSEEREEAEKLAYAVLTMAIMMRDGVEP